MSMRTEYDPSYSTQVYLLDPDSNNVIERGHILKTIELFNADNSMADVKQHSTFVNVDAMQLDTGSSNRRRVAAAAVLHHYTATPGSTRCT